MTATATTTGTARIAARPDLAVVELTVEATKPTAAAALADVSGRVEELTRSLVTIGIPEADRVTGGFVTHEHTEWQRDRTVHLGYRCASTTVVRVRTLDLLGAVLGSAVEEVGADVGGPTWVVEPDNPGRLESYRQAALDARRRAEAFASALGLTLGEVLEITDTPVLSVHRPEPMMARAAMTTEAAAVPIDTGDVEVGARVTVTFALVPG
jgi:uncharacterized protein YggE